MLCLLEGTGVLHVRTRDGHMMSVEVRISRIRTRSGGLANGMPVQIEGSVLSVSNVTTLHTEPARASLPSPESNSQPCP